MIEPAILRILDGQLHPVGMGVLVEPTLAVTCAHVVAAALGHGHPDRLTHAPHQDLIVDFPLLDAHHRKDRCVAKVVEWLPYAAGRAGDLACLALESVPSAAQPAPLRVKTDLWKHTFRAFGCPNGYNEGVWTDGEILSRQSIGYFQVQSVGTTGYTLQAGFSGSPVWSDQAQGVVGVLTTADTTPGVRAAYTIPARMILEVIKDAPLVTQLLPVHPETLGELLPLSPTDLSRLAGERYSAAMLPTAGAEELFTAGLLHLLLNRYDLAESLLTRFRQHKPTHGYGGYSVVLAGLQGERPAQIRDFGKIKGWLELLRKVDQSSAPNGVIPLLTSYLQVDYFKRNGFSAYTGDLQAQLAAVQHISSAEFEAFLRVNPALKISDLWRLLEKP